MYIYRIPISELAVVGIMIAVAAALMWRDLQSFFENAKRGVLDLPSFAVIVAAVAFLAYTGYFIAHARGIDFSEISSLWVALASIFGRKKEEKEPPKPREVPIAPAMQPQPQTSQSAQQGQQAQQVQQPQPQQTSPTPSGMPSGDALANLMWIMIELGDRITSLGSESVKSNIDVMIAHGLLPKEISQYVDNAIKLIKEAGSPREAAKRIYRTAKLMKIESREAEKLYYRILEEEEKEKQKK